MEYDDRPDDDRDDGQDLDEVERNPNNYEIYINPQIDLSDAKSTQEEIEGCLSVPGLSLRIVRFNKIKVRYYNQDGKSIKKPLTGFMSKLFQHELDHLNGTLMFQNEVLEGFAVEDSSITPELYSNLVDQTNR